MHAGGRRGSNSVSGISSVDSTGFFNSDAHLTNSRIRSPSGQFLDNKQINLLCGPSFSAESTRLGQSQQAIQSYGNMGLQASEGTPNCLNLASSLRTSSSVPGGVINGHLNNSFVMPVTQPEPQFSLSQQQTRVYNSQRQLLNGLGGQHNNMFSHTIGPQILQKEISGNVAGRGGTTINGNASSCGNYANSSYGAVPQRSADFQNGGVKDSNGNFYPLVSNTGASCYVSTGSFQEAVPATGSIEVINNSTSLKKAEGFIPSYDLFNDVRRSKSQDWKLQNMDLPYELLGSKQNNIEFGSSNSVYQGQNGTFDGTGSRNSRTVRKENISAMTEIEQKVGYIPQQNNSFLVGNSVRLKATGMPDSAAQDALFSDDVYSNELMNVVARQPQEGVVHDELEFNFDGYPLDDIQV